MSSIEMDDGCKIALTGGTLAKSPALIVRHFSPAHTLIEPLIHRKTSWVSLW